MVACDYVIWPITGGRKHLFECVDAVADASFDLNPLLRNTAHIKVVVIARLPTHRIADFEGVRTVRFATPPMSLYFLVSDSVGLQDGFILVLGCAASCDGRSSLSHREQPFSPREASSYSPLEPGIFALIQSLLESNEPFRLRGRR